MPTNNRKGKALKTDAEKLTKRLTLNLTEEEERMVMADYDEFVYPRKSMYLRARVLDKKIKKRVVNANLEKLEHTLVESNEVLNRIGVNVNQIAKHLNTYKTPAYKNEVMTLIKLFISAQQTMDLIHDTIHKIYENGSHN